jgi:retron-type reverse transcriptase
MTTSSKPFNIDKREVYEAYLRVRSNGGAAGVDGTTLDEFETDLKGNLYRIWNRMSSGAYFPPPVRAVPIPKKSGGQRILGVPTVADRVAQTVAKQVIEPLLEARASDAGSMTGSWSSTSRACSTTSTTSFCYGLSGSM